MSIDPFDWFAKFFGTGSTPFTRRNNTNNFGDMFSGFDEMRREMQKVFEDLETRAPKDLIREYETPEGKVREVGPIVYGYSMTIGPDGKPRVREFGNVKSPMRSGGSSFNTPIITSEREPMSDITTTDKEVKVVIEMPGVTKEKIKINAYDNKVEVTADDAKRKYHEVIEIPPETDIETAKSNYNNGILEITFQKKVQTQPKGKEIQIE